MESTRVDSKDRQQRWLTGRNLLLVVVVAIIISLSFRAVVGKLFRATTDAVAPDIPRGSHVWVYRLASTFTSGDIIVYDKGTDRFFGRVQSVNPKTGDLMVARTGESNTEISESQVVGKAMFHWRW